MSFNFGKDIVRELITYENQEPFNLVSQAPAIYLFSNQPSIANAASGSGAIASHTVNYWLESQLSPYKRTYTIPAIPSDGSGTKCRGFWEAINFVLQSSGTTETVIRQFDVEATEETDSWPEVTRDTLKAFYPAISAYLSDSQLDNMLSLSIAEVQLDFKNKGITWTRLYSLQDLTLAIAYKTIATGSLSQFKEEGDRFWLRYKEFQEKYDKAISAISLPIDTDGDGAPDGDVQPQPSYAYISR